MHNKRKFSKELAFGIALLMNSFAVSLLVKSDFGVATLSSLPLVLHEAIQHISFGWMNFLVQTALLALLIFITRQPKPTYLVSFLVSFVFGMMVDMFGAQMDLWSSMWTLRIFYFLVGWIMVSCGAALFILSAMPLMPFDLVVRDLSDFTGYRVRTVRTVTDVSFVSTALLISLFRLHRIVGVGVGTIFMMFLNGYGIHFFMQLWCKYYDFVTVTSFGRFLEKIGTIQKK